MKKVLSKNFFARPVLTVAPELLGKFLVREIDGKKSAFMITEVEAYDGEKDLACHASKKRSSRTETLYGEPGCFYVYLCYGMHFMLNIVTDKKEYPAAVLIRGIEGYSGPGKITKALRIGKDLNTKQAEVSHGLWFEDRGIILPKKVIMRTPRIGVDYAGVWAKKKYRFILKRSRQS